MKNKTLVKTSEITKNILANYYNEVVTKINKMQKKKPSEKQIFNQFKRTTKKYAQMIELHLDKIEIIKLEFEMP